MGGKWSSLVKGVRAIALASSTALCGNPKSSMWSLPMQSQPEPLKRPIFANPNVTVSVAMIAGPLQTPVVPSSPEGTSIAKMGLPD